MTGDGQESRSKELYDLINGSPAIKSQYLGNDEDIAQRMQTLMNEGIDPNWGSQNDNYRQSMLFEAVKKGHPDIALQLLEAGADPDRMGGFYDEKPIRHAIKNRENDLVRGLAIKMEDINTPVADEKLDSPTAMHIAVRAANVEAVRILLEERGSDLDVNTKNSKGKTALGSAVYLRNFVGGIGGAPDKVAKYDEIVTLLQQERQEKPPTQTGEAPTTEGPTDGKEIG